MIYSPNMEILYIKGDGGNEGTGGMQEVVPGDEMGACAPVCGVQDQRAVEGSPGGLRRWARGRIQRVTRRVTGR